MEILIAEWVTQLLSPLGLAVIIFLIFYYVAAKKQNRTFKKMDEFLRCQELTNQRLNLIVNEIRHGNRLLTEIAGMEYVADPVESESEPSKTQSSVESSSRDVQHKLYVGNIDYAATESELASYFAPYGQVEFVNIPVNRYTGKARGFGFVTFVSKEDAEQAAMALHGSEFKGRQIQVNFAKGRDSN